LPLDTAKTYGVVSNNYMRSGGDGYGVFATAGMNAYDFGPNLESVVADYLSANRPYAPYTDGRITAVAAAAPAEPASEAKPAEPAAQPATATEAKSAEPAAETAAAPAAETKHVIVKGDTLWDLAETAYGDGEEWRRISDANGNPTPRRLLVGTELTIPAK
jgi:5'-nucleotidase/UDP-sugar diphosphatase